MTLRVLHRPGPSENRILWGVDALSDSGGEQLATLRFLDSHFPSCRMKIEPVYVIKSDDLDLRAEVYTTLGTELCPRAEENLKKTLAGQSSPRLLHPRFLTQKGNSKRVAAQELIRYALTNGHELIAVTATPAPFLARWVRKSFIEHLVALSPIPILVAKPGGVGGPISDVVYATNTFSESRPVFERMAACWSGRVEGITVFVGTDREWKELAVWHDIAKGYGMSVDFRFNHTRQMGTEQLVAETSKLKRPLLIFDQKSGFGVESQKSRFLSQIDRTVFPILMVKPDSSTVAESGPPLKLVSSERGR